MYSVGQCGPRVIETAAVTAATVAAAAAVSSYRGCIVWEQRELACLRTVNNGAVISLFYFICSYT